MTGFPALGTSSTEQGDPSSLRPIFVEICAGRASFSKAAREAGFETISIDHQVVSPLSPILVLDLTASDGKQILFTILDQPRLFAVHMGLPCGTASRARDRPIPAKLRSQGAPSPKPLRSADHPLGLPNLTGVNKSKVLSANILYRLALEILLFLAGRDVVISIENPANSYLWPALVALAIQLSLEAARLLNQLARVSFHACCHGSTRRKNTAWLSSPGVYSALNAVCDYSHDHDDWTVKLTIDGWQFDTASEAAYPTLLAQRATSCLVSEARKRNWLLHQPLRLHDESTAVQGKQTKRHKALIPEYHHFLKLPLGDPCPPNAKIIAPHKGGEVREELVSESTGTTQSGQYQKVGVFHSPKQFLSMARSVQHPMDSLDHLEAVTRYALQFNLKHPQHVVKLERKKNLLHAKLLKLKLAPMEKALHDEMPASVAKVVADKQILLWKNLLEHYGYDDMPVVNFLTHGVRLVGSHDTPSCYPEQLKPATLTEDSLRSSAVWRRKSVVGRRLELDPDHIDHLVEATNEELELGFMEGPFSSEAAVSDYIGHDRWSVIRRFVLVQGAEKKLRPIDDCLEAQLNFAYTSTSYLKLQDVDYVVGLGMCIADAVSKGQQRDGDGTWLGKCLDLSKAYKQLAVYPGHRDLAVIFFHLKSGEPQYFVANSLMFGSTAAVYAFNRVSRSLWFLMNKMLVIPSGVFYDDFPMFSPSELAGNADEAASELLDLLGWRHARTGPKGKPFDETFQVLGCQVDLKNIKRGDLKLENKVGRVERLHEMLDSLSKQGSISLHESQVLHGLMRYACGFFAGRQLHQVCNEAITLCRRGTLRDAGRISSFCDYANTTLKACRPRILNTQFARESILIFTDGSWEDPYAGIGGVVIDTLSGWRAIYSGELPASLRDKWRVDVGDQLICQIELFAAVAIRFHLAKFLHNRRSIWWIDNEAARFSLIKGLSVSPTMRTPTRAFYSLEVDFSTFNWFERVPSVSNIADPPSRRRPDEIYDLLNLRSHEPFPCPRHLMEQLLC